MTDLIARRIATELSVREEQVAAAVQLLDGGATVPFIARYRKEATGALDDTQLRTLEERLRYLRDLEDRRKTILQGIAEQGKLTPELEQQILAAATKNQLEDLYLPYRPKRRTKAMIAREAGLGPLAELLLRDPTRHPEQAALPFVSAEKGVADTAAALEGAKQILMEQFAEDARLLGELREHLWKHATLRSTLEAGKEVEGAKFSDYFAAEEPIGGIPSHRALALFRGRNEEILRLTLVVMAEDETPMRPSLGTFCEGKVAVHFGIGDRGRPADKWLLDVARSAWRIKILGHLETELMVRLREAAEAEAIQVFGRNLHDLLLAAPAGPRAILGLDPGLRTGVKVAVVDRTGKVLDTGAVFPHEPRNDWDRSLQVLAALCRKHQVELISIGNGTASRETDKLAQALMKQHPELKLQKLVVSEAGASVYSASELAAQEFPELDVTLRGAVSIARRLQDPLAELCKIDPKAIGVGQYQHDVDPSRLLRALDAVVEDCVNAVGVDVNTASAPLLARVAGLNQTLARNIVRWRDEHGAFPDRKTLLDVPRLGKKAYEQAAGFLRIRGGANPLDRSAVHPEAYPVVEKILMRTGLPIEQLIGNSGTLRTLSPQEFADGAFGVPTVTDILKELEKPGRDPRPEFKTATFQEGVETLADLRPEMVLEGVVTNVTNFGAFVDIGVHQDGLVHISCMSDKFVKDPREIVKAGQVVKVKVLEVDLPRKRVALTMRMGDVPGQKQRPGAAGERRGPARDAKASPTPRPEPEIESPLAKQLAKLKDRFKGT